MIVRLRGKVWESYPNRLVVDAGGVGYEVLVPFSSMDGLKPVEGLEVDLRTYHHIRENGQQLYGFANDEERDVFLLLIDRVSGIGPAIAMAVLNGMPVSRFKACVASGGSAELSKIKGLGKKTAERIILELKDKVGVAETWRGVEAGEVQPKAADAELALVALGYKQVEARKAVRKLLDERPDASTEELVRGALKSMT
ncbi:holliday junction ATP-dependent DNA helicase RuvA [Haloferula helveola]|uniref:Holliday junction branch migration complex subunit RuvA n=1 Tax=Haloferula helveola TaxID=490095 RepID=A0ABM7RCV6_9BACT|nr:holliday junction ATP-dependent DNA helicase RuvA [Haloferula helveola]